MDRSTSISRTQINADELDLVLQAGYRNEQIPTEIQTMGSKLALTGAAGANAAAFLRKLAPKMCHEMDALGADALKAIRMKRAAKLLLEVRAEFEKLGIDPKTVPEKTLVPWLEHASLEDDDTLQTKWVKLLINAANPNFHLLVRPDYVHVLSQLSPFDAEILDWLYDLIVNKAKKIESDWPECGVGITEMDKIFPRRSRRELISSTENLKRLGVFTGASSRTFHDLLQGGQSFNHAPHLGVSLTLYGGDFVRACQDPRLQAGPK